MPGRAPFVQSMLDVRDYRDAVGSVVAALAQHDPPTEADVVAAVGELCASPGVRAVIDAAGSDALSLTARAVAVARDFTPSEASTARSGAHELSILFLQQIDLAWWAGAPDFAGAADVVGAEDLVDMRLLRREGEVRFGFTLASDRFLPRARNFAVRRWFPDLSPGTPGPSWPQARPEMVRLLNGIADEFALRAGPEVPPLWVNCLTRSVDDQCRLQELGFSAFLPSAHCRGWAADIEVDWFARFGARDALTDLLEQLQRDDVINAINEGRIWHVCPNPSAVEGMG